MKFALLLSCLLFSLQLTGADKKVHPREFAEDIILSTKEINIPSFPCAFNPSLCKTKEGYLLLFRYRTPGEMSNVSYIGIVRLDASFKLKGKAQLLNTRWLNAHTPSQSEDARLFTIGEEPYLIFNDNREIVSPRTNQRRDMYLCKLLYDGESFSLTQPLKLTHPEKLEGPRPDQWEKNWVPFDWEKKPLLSYTVCPHEVIFPDLKSGICHTVCKSDYNHPWDWGIIRGGTPAILIDGQYLAFFHSRVKTTSPASMGIAMPHYYMGAYTFAPQPPFALTHISTSPLIAKKFYTRSHHHSRIIFPGGFLVEKGHIFLAYGKDDQEIWLAKIDKRKLLQSLKKIE